MQNHLTPLLRRSAHKALLVALFGMAALSLGVHAATDISNTPLATTSDITAKPNVMFVLDDSGSMGWSYMPDDMNDSGAYGYKSSQCNGVAYNPNYDYTANLPVNPDGTSYPHASFTAAPNDGFQMSISSSKSLISPITIGTGTRTFTLASPGSTSYSTGTRVAIVNSSNDAQWMVGSVTKWSSPNLTVSITGVGGGGSPSDSWKVGTLNTDSLNNSTYYRYTGTKPKMGWKYTTSGLDKTNDGGFANECLRSTDYSSSVFTEVTVTTSSAEAQNYADWYAYYRKRVLMMRTAAGRSFSPIDSKYRVGFTTISNTSAAPSTKFLDVGPFDSNQKALFYADLYKADVNNSTPLRGALSKVGRYFANKAPGQTTDPMEYACQRNYTILSTDGYWNTGDETSTYGPLKLDGSTKVGQQDASEVKPMWDGAHTVVTTATPYTVLKHQKSAYTLTTTTVWGRTRYTISSSGCSSNNTLKTIEERRTQVKKETVNTYEDVTGNYTRTVVVTDGATTSDKNSSTAWGSPVTTGADPLATTDTPGGWSAYKTTSSCTSSSTAPATTADSKISTSTSPNTVVTPVSTDTPVAGTPATPVTTYTSGSSDSLADVAEYFYATDLRTSALSNCIGALGTDVCNNEVPLTSQDRAEHQHMTTFTLGLGMNGILPYDKDYLNPSLKSGSYYDLKMGTKQWPVAEASSTGVTHVDDLWHAAVNGRGQYWSASDPSAVAEAISSALSNVTRTIGSSSSAATSSLKPVEGKGNQVFVAKYTTKVWTGDLVSYTLDGTTGEIDTTKELWSAASELDKATASGRKIYYNKSSVTPARRDFNFTNLTADGLSGNFTNFCGKPLAPGQCATFDADPKAKADDGTNLVNYLRGDGSLTNYTYTKTSGTTTSSETVAVYRSRESTLGDIINASPVYVSNPPMAYADAGYAAYATAKADRTPVVLSASNDGMLHAFAAEGSGSTPAGTELWAFIPSAVMPELYRLADTNYETKHHFFVDGTPSVGDVYDGTSWKTIVVGGLNSGGKAYYALDITDTTDPKVLWEFTDANLGLTYGNPVITKRAGGKWVVVVTSGYNNTSGDGNGHLYVLDAITGKPVTDFPNGIPTMVSGTVPAGTSAAPSGLAKINVWVDSITDNTAKRVYGGDLLGNLWRFDLDNLVAPNGTALRLASFTDGTSPQPITVKPELALITKGPATYPAVMVATGQYLGLTDIASKQVQTVYGIKDPLTGTGLGDVRSRTDVVVQTLTDTADLTRTASTNEVDWATKMGWRVDLPSPGERTVVDMQLQYTTLAVASAIPGSSVCSPSGGSSWLYTFNVATGASVGGGATGTKLGTFLAVGLTWVELTDGTSRLIIPGSDAKVYQRTPKVTKPVPPEPDDETGGGGSHTATRTSWRELVN